MRAQFEAGPARLTVVGRPLAWLPVTMKTLASLICLCLLLASGPLRAETDRDGAAAVAQNASGGRVLALDKTERNGRVAWRVKVLTPKGEVRLLLVDAVTGRLQ